MRLAFAVAVLGSLYACGSSGSGGASTTDGGSTARRDPIDPTSKCYFTGDITFNGMTEVIRANGCTIASGKVGVTLFGMNESRTAAAYQGLQIQFYLKDAIAPGFVGTVALDDVKLSMSKDGVTSKWIGTSCTVEITKNEVEAGAADAGSHIRAWGKGSCAVALTVVEGASAPAVVGPYEFMFTAN